MIKADDGDGRTDTVTVEILEEMLEATPPAAPTATQEPPGFEAVFAHFFFLEKRKNCTKRKTNFFGKVNFLF